MIPGVELVDFIRWAGVLGVFAVIFAESGLLFGFFLPGDTLLFTAGFLTQAKILPISIELLALGVFVAAVAGDNVGYAFGTRIGRKLFDRPNSRVFKKTHLEAAEKFYDKYGGKTIVIARFVPTVRTFAPVIAGASKMNYRSFLFYNVAGAFLWAVGVTYLGYFLGGQFERMGLEIDQVLFPILLLIVFVSALPAIVHLIRNPRQRKSLWETANRQGYDLFGWDYDEDNKPHK